MGADWLRYWAGELQPIHGVGATIPLREEKEVQSFSMKQDWLRYWAEELPHIHGVGATTTPLQNEV